MKFVRIQLLAAVATVALLAGCTTAQIQSAVTAEQTAIQDVQNVVAAACGFVPTVQSIVSDVGVLFPQYGGTVAAAIVNGGITVLQKDICSAAPAPAALSARLRGSSAAAPVTIGKSTRGVVVQGYR